MNESTLCPACGFDLGFPPWLGTSPSHEICPSCGIQFGYTDHAAGDSLLRRTLYNQWRTEWIRGGMTWSGGDAAPDGWDPVMQLIRAGLPPS